MNAIIIGGTGLVGKSILSYAEKSTFFNKITSIARRESPKETDKVNSIIETDTDKWAEIIANQKDAQVYFSGFGSTRASAGSADNFVKIDYGVNYDCAKAAKEAGCHTCVLISSGGANKNSWFLYMKTKGRIESDIIDLKFKRTIILQPGVLIGERDTPRTFDRLTGGLWKCIRGSPVQFLGYPIYGEDVGRIAVELAEAPMAESDEPIVKVVTGGELAEMAKKYHQ